MITETPSTCQPTEMLLNSPSSGELKMLIAVTTIKMIRKSTNVSPRTCFVSPKFMPSTLTP